VPWSPGLDRVACTVIDQVELFGLAAVPESCQEITALASGAVLRGTVRCAIGRDLLLDTPDGPLPPAGIRCWCWKACPARS
jgi:hypothetical protein